MAIFRRSENTGFAVQEICVFLNGQFSGIPVHRCPNILTKNNVATTGWLISEALRKWEKFGSKIIREVWISRLSYGIMLDLHQLEA